MRKPDKNIYMDKSPRRKRQIYNWFNETVDDERLYTFYDKIAILLREGKFQDAVNKFKELVVHIINKGDTLGYILQENVEVYGLNNVVLDLFNGIVRPRYNTKRARDLPKNVTKVALKEVEEEIKQDSKLRFGLNVQGKREEAFLRVRKTGSFYLQSKDTGRFLKWTKTFKKEVEKQRSDSDE